MKQVVIIGNGISGITAARHIRKKSDFNLLVISAESDFFFSRTALMYIYMGHMKYEHTKPYEDNFWADNNINLVRALVAEVNPAQKQVKLSTGQEISYDVLVIASGSKSNTFNWKGIDAKGVQGLVSLQDLALMESNTKNISRAVIVGGGLIGIEMAEMLLSRNIAVTMLIREPEFWSNVLPIEEAKMISDHLLEHHVDLRKDTLLQEIQVDDDGKIKGIITSKEEEITCQFLGLTIGVSPNIDFVKNSDIATDRGILVNEFFETNIPDIYAIGDCAQFKEAPPGRKSIEQVWYTGRMHGETLAHTICGNKTSYKPGVWFNSAKFMDIEYQVYGQVYPVKPDAEDHVFWQHPNKKMAVRIVFDKEERHVLGFNVLGIRYRHAVCDRWIKNKTHIAEVMTNLREANFDPEFFDTYEKEIIALYNQEYPDIAVKTSKRRKIFGVF